MTRLLQVPIGQVQKGSLFCDADTDEPLTDTELNEGWDADILRGTAVQLVRAWGNSVELTDDEGAVRTVTIYDWSQVVWVLEEEK